MTAKEAALEAIRKLPDDISVDGIYAGLEAEFADEDSDSDLDATWEEKINRRVEDIQSGRVKTIPAEEIFPELRETGS